MKIDVAARRAHSEEPGFQLSALISELTKCPDDELCSCLKSIATWNFAKSDLFHWVVVLDRFDAILEKATCHTVCKSRQDANESTLDEGSLNDPSSVTLNQALPPPVGLLPAESLDRELLLQVLRFSALLLEHAWNRRMYSSTEHLLRLLVTEDNDLLDATLEVMFFLSKLRQNETPQSRPGKQTTLHSRLALIAEGWGGREQSRSLLRCCLGDGGIGSTAALPVHIEFFTSDHGDEGESEEPESDGSKDSDKARRFVIRLRSSGESVAAAVRRLITEHKVPQRHWFRVYRAVLQGRAFSTPESRRRYVRTRLLAVAVLVQSHPAHSFTDSVFRRDPELIYELVEMFAARSRLSESLIVVAAKTLTALCTDPALLPRVLSAVGASRHFGLLPSLLGTTVAAISAAGKETTTAAGADDIIDNLDDDVHSDGEKSYPGFSHSFVAALFGFVYRIAVSEQGSVQLVQAGCMATMATMLEDIYSPHSDLVTKCVRMLERLFDTTPAATDSFRDLNGMDLVLTRLEIEVKRGEITRRNAMHSESDVAMNVSEDNDPSLSKTQSALMDTSVDGVIAKSSTVDSEQSTVMLGRGRAALIKALLRFLGSMMGAPALADRMRSLMDGGLPRSLNMLIDAPEFYGASLFYYASTLLAGFIHSEPTCLTTLQEVGVTTTLLRSLSRRIPASAGVISMLPNTLSALCLNEQGLAAFVEAKPFAGLFRLFVDPVYLTHLEGDAPSLLGNTMDELLRHQPTLRSSAMEALIGTLRLVSELADLSNESCNHMETTNVGLEKNKPLVMGYLFNVATFLREVLNTEDHTKEFIKQGGLVELVRWFGLRGLPDSFTSSLACRAAMSTFVEPAVVDPKALLSAIFDALEITLGDLGVAVTVTDTETNSSVDVDEMDERRGSDFLNLKRDAVIIFDRYVRLLAFIPHDRHHTKAALLEAWATPRGCAITRTLGTVHRHAVWIGVLESPGPKASGWAGPLFPTGNEPIPDVPDDDEIIATFAPVSSTTSDTAPVNATTAMEGNNTCKEMVDILSRSTMMLQVSQMHLLAPPRHAFRSTRNVVRTGTFEVARAIADVLMGHIRMGTSGSDENVRRLLLISMMRQLSVMFFDEWFKGGGTVVLLPFIRSGGLDAVIKGFRQLTWPLVARIVPTTVGEELTVDAPLHFFYTAISVFLKFFKQLVSVTWDSLWSARIELSSASNNKAELNEECDRLYESIAVALGPLYGFPALPSCPPSVTCLLISTITCLLSRATAPRISSSSDRRAESGFEAHMDMIPETIRLLRAAVAPSNAVSRRRQVTEAHLEHLVEMGFLRSHARHALQICYDNVSRASDWLLTHPPPNVEDDNEDSPSINQGSSTVIANDADSSLEGPTYTISPDVQFSTNVVPDGSINDVATYADAIGVLREPLRQFMASMGMGDASGENAEQGTSNVESATNFAARTTEELVNTTAVTNEDRSTAPLSVVPDGNMSEDIVMTDVDAVDSESPPSEAKSLPPGLTSLRDVSLNVAYKVVERSPPTVFAVAEMVEALPKFDPENRGNDVAAHVRSIVSLFTALVKSWENNNSNPIVAFEEIDISLENALFARVHLLAIILKSQKTPLPSKYRALAFRAAFTVFIAITNRATSRVDATGECDTPDLICPLVLIMELCVPSTGLLCQVAGVDAWCEAFGENSPSNVFSKVETVVGTGIARLIRLHSETDGWRTFVTSGDMERIVNGDHPDEKDDVFPFSYSRFEQPGGFCPKTDTESKYDDDITAVFSTSDDTYGQMPSSKEKEKLTLMVDRECFMRSYTMGALCIHGLIALLEKAGPQTKHSLLRMLALLTRYYPLARLFSDLGGVNILLRLRQLDYFPGLVGLSNLLIRHVLEDNMMLCSIMVAHIGRYFRSRQRALVPLELRSMMKNLSHMVFRDVHAFLYASVKSLRLVACNGDSEPFVPQRYFGNHTTVMLHGVDADTSVNDLDALLCTEMTPLQPSGVAALNALLEVLTSYTDTNVAANGESILFSHSVVLHLLSELVISYPAVAECVALFTIPREAINNKMSGFCPILSSGGSDIPLIKCLIKWGHEKNTHASHVLFALGYCDLLEVRTVVVNTLRIVLQSSLDTASDQWTSLDECHSLLRHLAQTIYILLSPRSQPLRRGGVPPPRSSGGFPPYDIGRIMVDAGFVPLLAEASGSINMSCPDATSTGDALLKTLEKLGVIANSLHREASLAKHRASRVTASRDRSSASMSSSTAGSRQRVRLDSTNSVFADAALNIADTVSATTDTGDDNQEFATTLAHAIQSAVDHADENGHSHMDIHVQFGSGEHSSNVDVNINAENEDATVEDSHSPLLSGDVVVGNDDEDMEDVVFDIHDLLRASAARNGGVPNVEVGESMSEGSDSMSSIDDVEDEDGDDDDDNDDGDDESSEASSARFSIANSDDEREADLHGVDDHSEDDDDMNGAHSLDDAIDGVLQELNDIGANDTDDENDDNDEEGVDDAARGEEDDDGDHDEGDEEEMEMLDHGDGNMGLLFPEDDVDLDEEEDGQGEDGDYSDEGDLSEVLGRGGYLRGMHMHEDSYETSAEQSQQAFGTGSNRRISNALSPSLDLIGWPTALERNGGDGVAGFTLRDERHSQGGSRDESEAQAFVVNALDMMTDDVNSSRRHREALGLRYSSSGSGTRHPFSDSTSTVSTHPLLTNDSRVNGIDVTNSSTGINNNASNRINLVSLRRNSASRSSSSTNRNVGDLNPILASSNPIQQLLPQPESLAPVEEVSDSGNVTNSTRAEPTQQPSTPDQSPDNPFFARSNTTLERWQQEFRLLSLEVDEPHLSNIMRRVLRVLVGRAASVAASLRINKHDSESNSASVPDVVQERFPAEDSMSTTADSTNRAIASNDPTSTLITNENLGNVVAESGLNNVATEVPAEISMSVASPSAIDPAFLEALPDGLRQEVLAQQISLGDVADDGTSSALAPGNNIVSSQVQLDGSVNPDFLAALPANIQRDVLAQECQEQRRLLRESRVSSTVETGNNVDNTAFLATLSPELRREILADQEDQFIASELVNATQDAPGASNTRGQPRLTLPDDFASNIRMRALPNGHVFPVYSGGYGARRGSNGSDRQRAADRQAERKVMRDGPLLLDSKDIAPILALMFTEQPVQERFFHSMLLCLCQHAVTRSWIISTLLAIVEGARPSSGGACSRSAGESGDPAAEVGPAFARQILDTLFYLATQSSRISPYLLSGEFLITNAAAGRLDVFNAVRHQRGSVFSTEAMAQTPVSGRRTSGIGLSSPMQTPDRGTFNNIGKGKGSLTPASIVATTPTSGRLSTLCSEAGPITPLTLLFDLLTRPMFLRSGKLLNALLRLLAVAVRPIAPYDGVTAAKTTRESTTPADQFFGDELRAAITETTAVDAGNSVTVHESTPLKETEKVTEKYDEKPFAPSLSSKYLKSMIDTLSLPVCTGSTFRFVREVLRRLVTNPDNIGLVRTALESALSDVGQTLADDLSALIAELAQWGSALSATDTSVALSASPSVVRFRGTTANQAARIAAAAANESAKAAAVNSAKGKTTTGSHRPINLTSTKRFVSTSASQAVLLRLAKALSSLDSKDDSKSAVDRFLKLTHNEKENNKETDSVGTSNVSSAISSLTVSLGLEELWIKLEDVLNRLQSSNDNHTVGLLLPAIQSFFVLHGGVGLSENMKSHPSRSPSMSSEKVGQALTVGMGEADRLFTLAENHRKILNDIVRRAPNSLLTGPFAVLANNPRILDFDNKRVFFRAMLKRYDGSSARMYPLRLNVRRSMVFEDSYHQISNRTPAELKGKLVVRFAGEEGVDAGGVNREWFQVLAREMFNANYALFTTSAVDKITYQPNGKSYINAAHLSYFRFIGRVIAKAIHANKLLDCYFTRAFYKHILGVPVTYLDLEASEPEYFQSLKWTLENDITDILDLTFSKEMDEFGVEKIVDLKPNGRDLAVTQTNKAEYVQLVSELMLTKNLRSQIDAFLEGFHDLIPAGLISIFNEHELELLISGLPDIDVDDWKANTIYSGYDSNSPEVQWFWRAVRSFEPSERAKLLQFCTGTSKVPLQGFRALEGIQGIQRFSIHKDHGHADRLVSGHTCFNQLDLPSYESYDKLRRLLLKAIEEGSEGFGFS